MTDKKIGAKNPYVVAPRREKRSEIPDDWIDLIKKMPGVSVNESGSKRRVLIQADEDAIKTVISGFGEYCHVEPLIEHHLSDQKGNSVVSDVPGGPNDQFEFDAATVGQDDDVK